MEIIEVTCLKQVIRVLKSGGVIAYPTETSYGLGALFSQKKAIDTIFKIKERPRQKNFIILVKDISMAKRYVKWNALAQTMAKEFWPGPVTLVLPAKKGKTTLAIRISSHPFVKKLFTFIKEPLISTSLNKHGKSNCYSLSGCQKQFTFDEIDVFVNVGVLPRKAPSVLVDVYNKKILRPSNKELTQSVESFL